MLHLPLLLGLATALLALASLLVRPRGRPAPLRSAEGFRWGRPRSSEVPDEVHPSGFRWGASDGDPEEERSVAHPSGFHWRTGG